MTSLDEVDRQLLKLLQKDARQTNKELADAVGIAQSTCLERVRALRARGVVTGYRADVDLNALGRPIQAVLMVRLAPKTTASVRAFQHDMLRRPETLSVSTVAGVDDFILQVAVPDVLSLRDFILEYVTSRKDVVDARAAIVYETVRPEVVAPLD
ncbi:MAG: Lrp/AsnC family transcriptional regulator [Actinomycetota bacterium]